VEDDNQAVFAQARVGLEGDVRHAGDCAAPFNHRSSIGSVGYASGVAARISLLDDDPSAPFPPVSEALRRPDGLLAAGGDLRPERLLNAYRHAIFPWYSDGEPILWWSPDPRTVFPTDGVRLSSRFRRSLRTSTWRVRADTAFAAVIRACARTPRPGQRGTWITRDMEDAYVEMHRLGHAHSVEVFDGVELAGGIYGIGMGAMFFGESMFSAQSGGSKVALAALAHRLQKWGLPLIDAQVENQHLVSMGARRMRREDFVTEVESLAAASGPHGSWTQRFGDMWAAELAERPDRA
jgi:leucyl/phenylalanyl-tRNA--protein transferase